MHGRSVAALVGALLVLTGCAAQERGESPLPDPSASPGVTAPATAAPSRTITPSGSPAPTPDMTDEQTDAAPDPESGLAPEPLDDIPAETIPAPSGPVEPVTFTYRCWRDGADSWTVRDFATLNDAWAYTPASTSCVADIHGNQYSDLQAQAVAVAYEFLPQGLPQLEFLYGPCAVTDNRDQWQYLDAPNQAQKSYLEAQLMLCPERPYADEMRAVIAR